MGKTRRPPARTRFPAMRRRPGDRDEVAEFIARGFAVVPAAAPRGPGCSCSRVGCPDPGAHPVSYAWRTEASADPARLGLWRTRQPDANFASPTGQTHDVLDVPAAAGTLAFAALVAADAPVGPICASAAGDRHLYFTKPRPGAGDDEESDEWWPCVLDAAPETGPDAPGLRWHTKGSYVLIPPALGTNGRCARWIHEPGAPLPDPLQLLTALADACEAVAAQSR